MFSADGSSCDCERTRGLGLPAPGTYREFRELSAIEDDEGVQPTCDLLT